MKKYFVMPFIAIIIIAAASAQDVFSGKYFMENQAEYDPYKKWIEISRNQYQEIIISSENYANIIGYYDEQNNELFYVIEKHAQYNTLMKIKIINNKKIEVYVLDNFRWQKYPFPFIKSNK